jgi:hypothetical protein
MYHIIGFVGHLRNYNFGRRSVLEPSLYAPKQRISGKANVSRSRTTVTAIASAFKATELRGSAFYLISDR